ncbi:hypothetical protein Vi05172_g10410 [Venturia inaequalis]|nr:hypothetical protein Vi05172_g10410 [Venturia inaequalis]
MHDSRNIKPMPETSGSSAVYPSQISTSAQQPATACSLALTDSDPLRPHSSSNNLNPIPFGLTAVATI